MVCNGSFCRPRTFFVFLTSLTLTSLSIFSNLNIMTIAYWISSISHSRYIWAWNCYYCSSRSISFLVMVTIDHLFKCFPLPLSPNPQYWAHYKVKMLVFIHPRLYYPHELCPSKSLNTQLWMYARYMQLLINQMEVHAYLDGARSIG